MNIRKLLNRYNNDLDLYFEAIDRKKQRVKIIKEHITDFITRALILIALIIPLGLLNTLLENYR